MTHRSNIYDFIRSVAAVLVLAGHAYVITGNTPVPRVFGVPIETLGLYMFFGLSGFLIASSWRRSQNVITFLVNRCLRIFPALWVTVGVTVFILGPALTRASGSDYFASGTTWSYLLNGALVGVYKLPGVFEDGRATDAVNGSLWTLGVEFTCYLLVLACGMLLRRGAAGAWLIIGVGSALLAAPLANGPGTALSSSADVVVPFAAGAMLALIPAVVARSIWTALVCAAAFPLAFLVAGEPGGHIAAWIAVPAVVVVIGGRAVPGIRRFSQLGDPSYGIYVWGYLVQQCVLGAGANTPAANLGASLLILVPVAYASWHLLESPILTRKRAAAKLVSDRLRATRRSTLTSAPTEDAVTPVDRPSHH